MDVNEYQDVDSFSFSTSVLNRSSDEWRSYPRSESRVVNRSLVLTSTRTEMYTGHLTSV